MAEPINYLDAHLQPKAVHLVQADPEANEPFADDYLDAEALAHADRYLYPDPDIRPEPIFGDLLTAGFNLAQRLYPAPTVTLLHHGFALGYAYAKQHP